MYPVASWIWDFEFTIPWMIRAASSTITQIVVTICVVTYQARGGIAQIGSKSNTQYAIYMHDMSVQLILLDDHLRNRDDQPNITSVPVHFSNMELTWEMRPPQNSRQFSVSLIS